MSVMDSEVGIHGELEGGGRQCSLRRTTRQKVRKGWAELVREIEYENKDPASIGIVLNSKIEREIFYWYKDDDVDLLMKIWYKLMSHLFQHIFIKVLTWDFTFLQAARFQNVKHLLFLFDCVADLKRWKSKNVSSINQTFSSDWGWEHSNVAEKSPSIDDTSWMLK